MEEDFIGGESYPEPCANTLGTTSYPLTDPYFLSSLLRDCEFDTGRADAALDWIKSKV